jgi:hypothetical protein
MSYCRWSSDDFRCDVYVYESAHGWVTHVAGRRHTIPAEAFPPPLSEWVGGPEWVSQWAERHARVMDLVKDAPRQNIGLPHDGESYTDPTPGECAGRLESLMAIGYNVPQYAIDELRAESATGGPTDA